MRSFKVVTYKYFFNGLKRSVIAADAACRVYFCTIVVRDGSSSSFLLSSISFPSSFFLLFEARFSCLSRFLASFT